MIDALETKAASVAKRMSTAMFVRNDIRSKYAGILSKSVDYAAKYVLFYQIFILGTCTCRNRLQFVCVTKFVCVCPLCC